MRRFAVPALIFLLSLSVRLLYLSEIRGTPLTELLLIDSDTYDRLARRILDGTFHGEDVYAMNILYPYFLAGVYALGKTAVFPVLVLQAVLDAVSCVLVWGLGRRLFDPATGAVAGCLAALYAPMIFYSGALLTPTLITVLLLGGLVFLAVYQWCPGFGPAIAAGGLLGLATLGRGNLILFLPLAFAFFRVAAPSRKAFLHWATMLLAAGVILGGVTLRNTLVEGRVVPIAANYAAFYIGHNPEADGLYALPAVTEGASFEDEVYGTRDALAEEAGRDLTLAESSAILFRKGIDYARSHPRRELELAVTKAWYFWNAVEAPTNLNFYVARDYSRVLRILPVTFGMLAAFGLVGMVVVRRRWRDHLFLHLVLLVYFLTAILFFHAAEYRLPAAPVLMLFAAAALVAGVRALTRRTRVGSLLAALGMIGLLLVATHLRDDRLTAQTWKRVDYLNFGTLYTGRGQLPEARRMLERALAIDPNYPPAYRGLAEVAHREGNDLEAARLVARADRLLPETGARSQKEMLEVAELYRAGRYAEARVGFQRLYEVSLAEGDTTLARSHRNNVGLCLYKTGDLNGAAAIFEEILGENPDYIKARNNLGLVRLRQGRPDEAAVQFRETLARDPDNRIARRELERLPAGTN